jgi:hypothetical protein
MSSVAHICALLQLQYICISTSKTLKLGAIISCSSGHTLADPVEIAVLPNVGVRGFGWQILGEARGVVMEGVWKQYFLFHYFGGVCSCTNSL